MSRVGGLLVALSKDWLRSREAVFFSFAFPLVLLVIFSAVFSGGSAGFTVYVQNNDVGPDGEATNLSAALVESLEGVDALSVRSLSPERDLAAWSRQNRTAAAKRVVVIPDGFAARARNGSVRARRAVIGDTLARAGDDLNDSAQARLERRLAEMDGDGPANATVGFLATSDDTAAPAVRGVVSSVVARFNDRAIGVDQPPVTVETGDLSARDLEAVDYYLPAIIAAVVLINGVITVTSVVATFTSDGTLERLAATPLRKRDWILATVVQQSVLALVTTGLMILVARLLFGVVAVPGPLSVALVLLGAVAFSALGVALGGFLDDPDAATSLGNAIALPLMFVSGVFWQIDLMPAYLQTVARLSPVYHFHRGLRQLLILNSTDGVALPFAMLAGVAAVTLALAVRVTRWRDFEE